MENQNKLTTITARSVIIEVQDEKSGNIIRHELPIDYFENANAIRLRGENMEGKPVEMAFYSNVGLSRLIDLTGGGADHDPCGGHTGEA